jgi:circadian clock protein KaiC
MDTPENGRVTTGNASADEILGGGFPANTINIVMGQPGTGKTVFMEQLLFAHAHGERPVLYVTTLAEPLAKVVRFVQGFEFYDQDALGTTVLYEEIGGLLMQHGASALVPRLKEVIKELRPAVIVIDSFRAVHDLSDSAAEVRRLVHDLTGLLTAYETTTFLVGEYHQEDIRHHPEFAVADGVVELSRRALGTRDERFFRVLKLRGSSYQEGLHGFQITSGGLRIHPRLVTPGVPVDYTLRSGRVSTGVPGLDALLDGGLVAGSATLLAGPSGSGKTTIGLQFALEGVRRGEPSVCINFQENPTQLARTALRVSGDEGTVRGLELVYNSPVELQIDSIIVDLFQRIDRLGVRRLVLDGVRDLGNSTSEPRRAHDYLYAMVQHLAVRGITSIFTMEVGGGVGSLSDPPPINSIVDNLLVLEMEGDDAIRRTIRVRKARDSAHDPAAREIDIRADGIHVS